jgi:Xaa-Pro aminopeptidase
VTTVNPAIVGTYVDRLRRTQEELKAQEIDLLLVGPSSDLFYLTGFEAHESERMNLLLVPQVGEPQMVMPALEAPLMKSISELMELPIHSWSETESPSELAAKLAGDVDGKKVAVSNQLWSVFLMRLQEQMHGANWTPATEVMRPLRAKKDSREIELLREVSHRTDDAWHEFITTSISGLTEAQAMERLVGLMSKRGMPPSFGICASGPHSASPHHHTGDRVIQLGDTVIFDWGGTLGGYHSDVTRTAHIGEPDEEYRRVYDIVRQANQAALDAVKPGATCESIDRAARAVITDAGYGEYFIHRVGHGLGLDVHEEPYLVEGNTLTLQVGMVFSDEPGIYIEGRFGVRIEVSVVCTATGGERLNEATRELTIMN